MENSEALGCETGRFYFAEVLGILIRTAIKAR